MDFPRFFAKVLISLMKIVCAWCQKILTEYESPTNMVSHGICPECLRGLTGEGTVVNLRDFLDRLGFPVLVTDRSVMVQQANRMAERVFGRPASQLQNAGPGMAIECHNARAFGQCGKSEHCAGCILRRTIMETHGDGRPRYSVYSQNDILTPEGAKPKRFRFSTTQIGDAVMLSIEDIQDLPAAS